LFILLVLFLSKGNDRRAVSNPQYYPVRGAVRGTMRRVFACG
jgi:hypothetical protein